MISTGQLKTYLFGGVYRYLLRPLLFSIDPERVHNHFIKIGSALGRTRSGRFLTKIAFYYDHPSLKQTIAGINFPNPVGLAAGFDKDAQLTDIIANVGFGFEEVGSVTGEPCTGNKGKRLWRLPKAKSLVVYYGLKNKGCLEISERLASKRFTVPLGVSIAKTNNQETVTEEIGIRDYAKAYAAFVKNKIGDYFAINISCPNTFGGEPFVNPEKLDRLLKVINEAKLFYQSSAPIFIKLPVDIPLQTVEEIIKVARQYKIAGFICANVTKDRKKISLVEKNIPPVGGFSGKPLNNLSNKLISYIYQATKDEFIIIGCGGIFSAKDAYEKIKAGASLVQLITGMIFNGPSLISEINQGLVKLLKKDGFSSISEAVGKYK